MGLFNFSFFRKKPEIKVEREYWSGANIMPAFFDGEKTPFELGNPYDLILDYPILRARAWQAYIESPLIQNAIKKYCLWVIGSGLKIQSNPIDQFIDIDEKETKLISSNIEAKFRLYANMKSSTYNRMQNLHELSIEAFKNAILSGDVLNILRFDGNKVTHEIIDGIYINTPIDRKYLSEAESRGNKIIEGVEIDKTGKHIAFYVQNENFKYQRIEAYGKKSGRLQAWLMIGLKYKLNKVRGMSFLTAVLETDAKLNRYQDATLGSAEENAKVPYTIEHNQFSDGENPMVKQLAQAMGKNKGEAPETKSYLDSEPIAAKVAQTTSKSVYNLPIGSSLKRNNYSADSQFSDFYTINENLVYITLGFPPEVARDFFNNNYSSSRAALKSFEYKLLVDRDLYMKNQFYKPNFDYWLDHEIMMNRIDIPQYLEAILIDNYDNEIIKEAYRNCRFIGATVPHIDPVKEVNAERLKLGKSFENIPISTAEQSCELLNTGDFDQIIKKTEDEKEMSEYFDDIDTNIVNTNTVGSTD
jgi:capsid protein